MCHVCHTQAAACMTINSRYTAGGRGRFVYDALVDQILPRDAICYAFELHNFLTRRISDTAWDRHILPLEQKTGNYVFYPMAPFLMTFVGPSMRPIATDAQQWRGRSVWTLSGNSLKQTVYTHRASVHQAAKLVATLLRVARVTAGLA